MAADTNVWEIVAAIFTAITGGAVGFAVLQLREARNATKAQAIQALYQMWGGVEERKARAFVFSEDLAFVKSLDTLNKLQKDQDERLKNIETALVQCNHISHAVLKGVVARDDALELFGRPIKDVWNRCRDFVRLRREQRKEPLKVGNYPSGAYMVSLQKFVEEYLLQLDQPAVMKLRTLPWKVWTHWRV